MDAHENWTKNAIIADVEVMSHIKIKAVRLSCPWCQHYHMVICNRSSTISGKSFCDNCGQFFSFVSHDGNGATKRVLAHPKKKVRTQYGEEIRRLSSRGHNYASVSGDNAPADCGD